MYGFTKEELKILKSLNTPKKIQDYLNKIPINFEEDGRDTLFSPRMVLRNNKAHCIEGAFLAAAAFRVNGEKPLIVDLVSTPKDFDHVICVFQRHGRWGAISKTNHAVLRYREPVYETIRELVMSFFHEYFDDNGKKTLRSYSAPISMEKFDSMDWMTAEHDLWDVEEAINNEKHFPILGMRQIWGLRRADKTEITAGKIVEWESKKKK